MKPWKILITIYPYLICEGRQYISSFWPPLQRRNRDPQQIGCWIWRNVENGTNIVIIIYRVNSISEAKRLIFCNILGAIFFLRWACSFFISFVFIPSVIYIYIYIYTSDTHSLESVWDYTVQRTYTHSAKCVRLYSATNIYSAKCVRLYSATNTYAFSRKCILYTTM